MVQFILRLGQLFLFSLRITPQLCPINYGGFLKNMIPKSPFLGHSMFYQNTRLQKSPPYFILLQMRRVNPLSRICLMRQKRNVKLCATLKSLRRQESSFFNGFTHTENRLSFIYSLYSRFHGNDILDHLCFSMSLNYFNQLNSVCP